MKCMYLFHLSLTVYVFLYTCIIHVEYIRILICTIYILYVILCSILYSYIVSLEGPKADELYSSLGPPSVNKIIIIIILKSGKVPDDWCMGYITPIFKSGDAKDPGNYRGITLLSCMGNFFVANNRLNAFVKAYNIVGLEQAGFKKDHSTIDHIFTLKSLIDFISGFGAGNNMIDPHVILAMPFNFILRSSHLYYRNTQFLLWQCHLT